MERYQYQALPQPVMTATHSGRQLYREKRPVNIHFDRRVVRGNTYAAAITTLNQLQAQAAEQAQLARTRKRPLSRQSVSRSKQGTGSLDGSNTASARAVNSNGVPVAVASAQTDADMEELVEHVQEKDAAIQTDDVEEEKPMPVMFVPKHRGVDKFTSVESGELFDFDTSVTPLIEVLLGKATDQGLTEVREEEEIKNLQQRIKRYEEMRDEMTAESQKLEQANLRRHQEKERRLEQDRRRRQEEEEVKRKVQARATAHQFLAGLQESVFKGLEEGGAFYDPTERAVSSEFMPWLQAQVISRLSHRQEARETVDMLISDAIDVVVQEKAEIARQERMKIEAEERKKQEEEAARQAELERRRKEEEEEEALREEAERMAREEEELMRREALAGGEEGIEGGMGEEGDDGYGGGADVEDDQGY